ncbi:MAG: Co2+/Mg2+ efflux protein ApaG [Phycisphaerales bacterium]
MTTATPVKFGSEAVTDGIRVSVTPAFVADSSDPASGRFHFAYHVMIVNEGEFPVTLRRRRWHIVDADGGAHDVEGEGVVGQQPTLSPGGKFEYQSYAPLMTSWGTMEGTFTFERADQTSFDAAVGRFFLVAPEPRRRA